MRSTVYLNARKVIISENYLHASLVFCFKKIKMCSVVQTNLNFYGNFQWHQLFSMLINSEITRTAFGKRSVTVWLRDGSLFSLLWSQILCKYFCAEFSSLSIWHIHQLKSINGTHDENSTRVRLILKDAKDVIWNRQPTSRYGLSKRSTLIYSLPNAVNSNTLTENILLLSLFYILKCNLYDSL